MEGASAQSIAAEAAGSAEVVDEREAGFEALHRREHAGMLRVAFLLLDAQGPAEQAVHDAFAKVYERWHEVDDPGAHLRTCVVDRCRVLQRRRRLDRERRPDPGRAYDELEARELLDALAELPMRQRAAVVLRVHEGLSEADTATALGVAPGTVRSSVSRALAHLGEVAGRGNDRPLHPHTDDDEVLVHRLRAELARRAADATVPEAGDDRVHDRIRRRHRDRRLLVGGGALVAVLALLLAGLGAMARDDEPTVVDTGGATTPFLGFENATWVVVSYAPGRSYGVVDDVGQPSDEAIQLLVSNDAAVAEPLGFSRVRERTLENMRGDLQVGRLDVVSPEGEAQQTGPAVWWSPVPGWTATLTGSSPGAFADAEELLAAADAVVDVDRATWEARLR